MCPHFYVRNTTWFFQEKTVTNIVYLFGNVGFAFGEAAMAVFNFAISRRRWMGNLDLFGSKLLLCICAWRIDLSGFLAGSFA